MTDDGTAGDMRVPLRGTYVFDGGPSGDTVSYRFADDSIMYFKLNGSPEIRKRYSFRSPYFMAWTTGNDGPGAISPAGKLAFKGNALEMDFAHVLFSAAPSGLRGMWTSGTFLDSLEIKEDRLMIEFDGGRADTSVIRLEGGRIVEEATRLSKYEYKLFSDTLMLMYGKRWTFARK